MPRLKTANNVAIEAGIVAIARAQQRIPGFDLPKAKEICNKIDALLKGYRTAECTAALAMQLLIAIGYADARNESLYRPD